MQTCLKFGLSAIASAALIACGGGGTDTSNPPTPPVTNNPVASTLPATSSAAVFLASGASSTAYSLNNCEYFPNIMTLGNIATGGTATITLNSNGTVNFTSAAFGTAPNVAPDLNRTFEIASTSYASLEVTSTGAVASRTQSYSYFIEGSGGSRLELQYSPSNTPVTNASTSNRVVVRLDTNSQMICGYAVDPQLVANIPDYNARIAQLTSAVTVFGTTDLVQVGGYSGSSGTRKWNNSDVRTTIWAQLNYITGQLASSSSENGTYVDFNIGDRMMNSSTRVSFKEEYSPTASRFTTVEQGRGTSDGYEFRVVNGNTLEPKTFFTD